MRIDPALERHCSAVRLRLRTAGVTRPGPGSISWCVNREIVIVAGWGRAILLQLAHPLVAVAIDEHSGFRDGVSARLQRVHSTVGAMLAVTFGDDERAIAAAARINSIHDRVFGANYSAHDPELLRWVHATLLDSNLRTFEILVGPLSPEERTQYCEEAVVMAPLLDIPAGLLPKNATELDAYIRRSVAHGPIAVTDRGRALARAALFPRGWRLLWPLFRPVQLLTIGLLPPPVRVAYGFEWSEREERSLARWAFALRGFRRLMPAAGREWRPARRSPAAKLASSM